MDVLEWTPNCPPPQSAENDLPWSQPLLLKSLGTLVWWILHSPWCVSSQCQGRVWKKHCCGAWATGAQGMVPKPHVSLPLGGHHQLLPGCTHRAFSAYSCMQKAGSWTNFLCVKQCSRCWGHRSELRGWDAYPSGSHLPVGAENTCCCFHAWPYRPHEEVTLEQRWARGIGISQEGVPESGTSWYTSHRKHICLVWGSSQDMRVIGARKAERR